MARECFGEIAVFTGALRTASVVALVDSPLRRLSKEACDQLVKQYPAFSPHICRLLGQRLVERDRELILVSIPWWQALGLIHRPPEVT